MESTFAEGERCSGRDFGCLNAPQKESSNCYVGVVDFNNVVPMSVWLKARVTV